MTPFNLWMAVPPVVSALAVLVLSPRRLRHPLLMASIAAACAALFVVPVLDLGSLLPMARWLANPVFSMEGLQAVFGLEVTWERAAALALAAFSLAVSVYRLDPYVPWTAVFGTAVQTIGAGLALLSGDMLSTVLFWQVMDMGRWLSRGRAALWEVVGNLAVLFGVVQLSSASGTAIWGGLRPSALHPTWAWLLTVALGLKLYLFPAMVLRETSEGRHGWTFFGDVSALAVAFVFADSLKRSGLNVADPLGPWAVLSVLLLLAGWATEGDSAPEYRSFARTILACGLAMVIPWSGGGMAYVLLGAAAAVYVVCATIDRPSLWPLGAAVVSCFLTAAVATSVGQDPLVVLAGLALACSGLVAVSSARGRIGLGALVAVSVGAVALMLAATGHAAKEGRVLGAVVAGLALAWFLLGFTAAGWLKAAVRVGMRGRGAFDGPVSDLSAAPRRGRWLALLPDGSALEDGVRAGLERLSGAIERRSAALGGELAMTWIVVVAVLVFMLLLR